MEADLIHCLNERTKDIELRIIYSRNFISTVSHKFEVFFSSFISWCSFSFKFVFHSSRVKVNRNSNANQNSGSHSKTDFMRVCVRNENFHVIMYFIRVNDVITIVVFAWEARWTFNFKIGFFVESKNTTFWIGTFKCSVEISGKFSR